MSNLGSPYQPPPKWVDKLLERFCAPELLEEVLGDLHERYYLKAQKEGEAKARGGYWREVLAYLRPSIFRRSSSSRNPLIPTTMFRNYFKVGLRNIFKYKVFSFINIFGLAIAMSIGMLLILMLADQKSYDSFHENKDRIYRVLMHPATHSKYATAPFPLAESLKTQYPFVEEATSLRRGFGGDAVYQKKYAEIKGYFTDASFFNIFSVPLEEGDPSTALNSPNSMIISRPIAQQLFGEDDPLGKTIDFTDRGSISLAKKVATWWNGEVIPLLGCSMIADINHILYLMC